MIKSNNKYNPKSKTCFSFPFHLGNNIGGKKKTFYKYEYKHKMCLPMIQTGSCKLVRKNLLKTLKATSEEVQVK